MKLFAVISILALSSMAFAADKTMDIVTGSQVTTATIQDAYVVGKQTRVSRHTFQSPTLIVEFSDGTKPVSITAHNGVEAGWLVNYINFGGADLKITDTVPAQDGSKKADPASIDNFKIVVNGDSSTLDAFSDKFRDAANDRGYYTDRDLRIDHSAADFAEGMYGKLKHDLNEVKKDDEQAPFPAGSNLSFVTTTPAIRLAGEN